MYTANNNNSITGEPPQWLYFPEWEEKRKSDISSADLNS